MGMAIGMAIGQGPGGTSLDNTVRIVLAEPTDDWILLDMEHSPNDLESLLTQLQAAAPYPEDAPTAADAVLYLMRHLHAADMRFLESFHDQGVARAAPVASSVMPPVLFMLVSILA